MSLGAANGPQGARSRPETGGTGVCLFFLKVLAGVLDDKAKALNAGKSNRQQFVNIS
jgi:hypothetical protein